MNKKDNYTLRIKESEIDYYASYAGYTYVVFSKPFEINQPPLGFVPTADVPRQ